MRKLTLLCRIEPGCLGPQGVDHVEAFCRYAHAELKSFYPEAIAWLPLPRYDKSLAEFEYLVGKKNLSFAQAQQLLTVLGIQLNDVEEQFHDKIADLIDLFLMKQK
ncbi:hypothetical protein [Shewanella waksmanii]|uniref:hypothetical protein n=1 Tax=Shewanella waksmanii TaxID=213783 RepID=UPI00048B315C|nr:hypothetical protein [Shewanella waksmanii]